MLRSSKAAVLLSALVLCGLLASSAGAAEWHTNGHKHSTTTSTSIRIVYLPPILVLIECSTSTETLTLRVPTVAGSTAPGLGTTRLTPSGVCTVSGTPGYSIACGTAPLNALSYTGGTTLATAGGGITTGTISSIDCRLSFGTTTCSTITGSAPTHYINPNPIATGTGSLTVTGQSSSLTVAKIGAGCAALPHGDATLGSPGAGGTVGNLTYNIAGPNAPYIYRTP